MTNGRESSWQIRPAKSATRLAAVVEVGRYLREITVTPRYG